MPDKLVTLVTERGQTSIPASLRKAAGLRTGQHLIWQQVSETEFRVIVAKPKSAPGPLAMLGYSRRFHPEDLRSTDEVMRELREGE